jgi:transcription-repair coupling factor (superfamily II helicase)
LLADRLLTLYELARGTAQLLIVDAGALLNRLPPPEFVIGRSLVLNAGDR